jgi:hypothetical protein
VPARTDLTDLKDLRILRHTLKTMGSTALEPQPGPRRKIAHRSARQDFSRSRHRTDARTYMNREPAPLFPAPFALADVNAGADADADATPPYLASSVSATRS